MHKLFKVSMCIDLHARLRNIAQVVSCVHGPSIRFENKDFICWNLIASNQFEVRGIDEHISSAEYCCVVIEHIIVSNWI